MAKKALFFFFVLLSGIGYSQNKDAMVASEYLKNGEFEKAADLYSKLYDKQPAYFYSLYLQSLLGKKDYQKAEKIAKKASKTNEKDPGYLIDLGYVLSLESDIKKSNQAYDKAIKIVLQDPAQTSRVANAFVQYGSLDKAIETYQKVREKTNYKYHFELADLFSRKQDIESMMNEYLDVLAENASFLQNIQNYLQTNLATDSEGKKGERIKNLLIRKIQEYPENYIFNELLSWLFIQQKDFLSAYIQAKAIDKRNKEDGHRLMDLAEISLQNEDYDVAVKCYDYLVKKGPETKSYIPARIGLLAASTKKITSGASYTNEELKKLEADYHAAFSDLGKNANSAPLIRGLAHLEAFYLNKLNDAIELLNQTIEIGNLNPKFKAECKIELGDILLMKGEVWDATLLYDQVDLDFKGSPLGEEAKLKNAKLYYYTGDFKFSQSMLDVLKTGTSHLIANDAMELSLLITENIDPEDSNITPLLMYSRADLLEYQNRHEESLKTLDSLSAMFPGHSLSDEALFKKAFIFKKQGKFQEAANMYASLIEKFPTDLLADDALFNLAELYENRLADKNKAKDLYESIITKYPSSFYVSEARKRFRILRGDNLN